MLSFFFLSFSLSLYLFPLFAIVLFYDEFGVKSSSGWSSEIRMFTKNNGRDILEGGREGGMESERERCISFPIKRRKRKRNTALTPSHETHPSP